MAKTAIKSIPIVKNFGRKNYGTTVGQQVIGLGAIEQRELETPHRKKKKRGNPHKGY